MNDFDYDALQKKRIAAGARHMKRGSRSKRCSLPSDNLTPAQLKRRNGPVSTYKLDEPMRWDDFKSMPVDLQKKYLTNLVETYGATNEMLGDMFYIHPSQIGRVKKQLGIAGQKNGRPDPDKKAIRDQMWAAFCNGVVGGGDTVKETPKEPPKEPKKVETLPVRCPDELEEAALTQAEPERKYLELGRISAEFTGPFNLESLASWLAMLPVKGTDEVRIRVDIETR